MEDLRPGIKAAILARLMCEDGEDAGHDRDVAVARMESAFELAGRPVADDLSSRLRGCAGILGPEVADILDAKPLSRDR